MTDSKSDSINFIRRELQYLFKDREYFVLMDVITFDQMSFAAKQVGGSAAFMKEGLEGIIAVFFEDYLVSIQLPPTVELEIVDLKSGASGAANLLSATLETGAVIDVPANLLVGQIIFVDTTLGKYKGLSMRS